MQVRITGSDINVRENLAEYVEEHLKKETQKYFENAVDGEVHFLKDGPHMIRSTITINEGIKGGIVVKSDGVAGETYGAFNEALEKSAKQLRRYKRKIKNYRRQGLGIKEVEPVNYDTFSARKYVIPPYNLDAFADMQEQEAQDESNINVINEKSTDIERLSVNEAIMKMDLANLPALAFVNKENNRINVVYNRKDGNISWVDPKNDNS